MGYSYPGALRPALDQVSLRIEHGECLGLVGATGAGKSTLADLVMGLLPPSAGEIRIDGGPLSGNETAWQRGIGFVAPAAFLVNDTIRRNVALGVEAVDEQRLTDALHIAQLSSVLAQLDGGVDAFVGEGGARLSAGERQRVGIARALYRAPHTLVLDEALAAVDPETERRILDAIRERANVDTLLIVTHRPFTLRQCDRVVLLEAGRVAAIGDYETLAREDGKFMRLM